MLIVGTKTNFAHKIRETLNISLFFSHSRSKYDTNGFIGRSGVNVEYGRVVVPHVKCILGCIRTRRHWRTQLFSEMLHHGLVRASFTLHFAQAEQTAWMSSHSYIRWFGGGIA